MRVRTSPDDVAQDASTAESFQAESGVDDRSMLDPAEGRIVMLTVDATATLIPQNELSDEDLTDLIAAVIDYLDALVIEPSVSTTRTEAGVRVEISVVIDTDDPWAAQAQAAAAMRDAFESTVPAVAGMTHDLVLQAA
jgi:hypothetical protein